MTTTETNKKQLTGIPSIDIETITQWLLREYESASGARFKNKKAARLAATNYIKTMTFAGLYP